MKQTSANLHRLVLSALLIGLATFLSFVKLFQLPFGGAVTLCSMLPLILITQLFGTKWGLLSCSAYGIIQMFIDSSGFSFVTGISAYMAVVLFDYLLAFGLIGLAGLTRGKKITAGRMVAGTAVACVLRYVCHVISGIVVWKAYAELSAIPEILRGWALFQPETLIYGYAIYYNATYMLPEMLITMAAGAALATFIKFDRVN